MSAMLRRRPGASRFVNAVAAAVLAMTAARADVFWVNYDPAKDEIADSGQLPEFCGWQRVFGNVNGGPAGDIRWIEAGCFAIDSRGDSWSYDYAAVHGFVNPDSESAERLVVTWRFLIADSVAYGDLGVWLAGDVNEEIAFTFQQDNIFSLHEQWEHFFTLGEFHTFRLTSAHVADGAPYRLWIDDEFVHTGYWDGPTFNRSWVGFGDQWMGGVSGSLSYWDFFRFGIIRLGDVNMDGSVDFYDIDPFIDALSMSEDDFQARHATWSWLAADCNEDSRVDFDDIDSLLVLLGGASWPEIRPNGGAGGQEDCPGPVKGTALDIRAHCAKGRKAPRAAGPALFGERSQVPGRVFANAAFFVLSPLFCDAAFSVC